LLKHGSADGRDKIWSNNGKHGNGKNWLGMQLMLLRDELRCQESGCNEIADSMMWTKFLKERCQIDVDSGETQSPAGAEEWHKAIRSATDSIIQRLPPPPSIPAARQPRRQPR